MARLNIFEMVNSISKESISHPDVNDVKVDVTKETPEQVKEDTSHVCPDEPIKAAVTNTKTSEPGPKDGGGDGTAHTENVVKVDAKLKIEDVNPNLTRDQQGGKEVDDLPNKVSPKDHLSASDISTSVEEHADEVKEGGDGSEETGLKTIDASGAEEIEKADDLVMDLDGEELEVTGMTDVTESKLAEVDSVAAKAASLSKATATVERYHSLMVKMHNEGRYMSDELRQAVSWALEDIDGQMFFNERAALESFNPESRVSLEANDAATTSGSSRQGTIDDGADPGEVGKGLGGKLKEMFKAGVKIFWRLVNMVSDLITSLAQDVGKIKGHLTELRKRVNVLEGGTEFTMKNPQRLMIGDEFVGDSKNAIAKVQKTANELLVTWPSALAKIIEDWKSERGNFGKTSADPLDSIINGLETAVDRAFRSFENLTPGDRAKVPSGFLDADRLHWSGPLPGNMALYAGVKNSKSSNAIKASMDDAKDAVTLNFSLIPGAESRSNDATVSTPSAGEAVSVIRELEKLCTFIQDAKDGMRELKKFTNSTTDAIDNSGKDGLSGHLAGIMVIHLAKTSTESQHRFIGYLMNMIKGYIGFLEASIKAEAAGNTIDA